MPWAAVGAAVKRALLAAEGSSVLTREHFASEDLEPDDGTGDLEPTAVIPPATDEMYPVVIPDAGADAARVQLDALLRRHAGDMDQAAHELGLSRSQLYRRASRLGLRHRSYRKR